MGLEILNYSIKLNFSGKLSLEMSSMSEIKEVC